MSDIAQKPEVATSDPHPRRVLTLVPAVPHIDAISETAPPWTVPSLPDYALDPHLELVGQSNHSAW